MCVFFWSKKDEKKPAAATTTMINYPFPQCFFFVAPIKTAAAAKKNQIRFLFKEKKTCHWTFDAGNGNDDDDYDDDGIPL